MDFKDRVRRNIFESSSNEPEKKPRFNPRSLDFIQNRLMIAYTRRDWDMIEELIHFLSLRN